MKPTLLNTIKLSLTQLGLIECSHNRVEHIEVGNGWRDQCKLCGIWINHHLHQSSSMNGKNFVQFIEGGGTCRLCKKGEELPHARTEADCYRNMQGG